MTHRLQIKDPQGEREVLLVDSLAVGRDPRCDISAADPQLSRRHAEFVVSGATVVVRDLGSRNGILVNGRRLTEAVLSAGDVVQIAQLVVTFLSTIDPTNGTGEPEDKTAILSARGIKQVAAASAARPAGGRNGNGNGSGKRPAGWSVKVTGQDERTSMVAPPGPSAFDRVGPTLDGSALAPSAWLEAPEKAERSPMPDQGQARPSLTRVLLPTLALAGVCFVLGVGATVWWLGRPPGAGAPAPVVLAGGFVLAVGAGAVAARTIRRLVSAGSRTETPAGGRAHLRG